MLRILQAGNSLPISFIVDPAAEFEPGQVAQLGLNGNQQVCGVSDGRAPIGIIDDIKKNSFSSTSIDEVRIVTPPDIIVENGRTIIDVKAELNHPHVMSSSFVSRDLDVELNADNGVITFLAGTELNFDNSGGGVPDSIRTVVSYSYQIPNVPGDDSTFASGMITVWFQKMLFATDQFETNQRYPINAPLFVSESGLLTTRQIDPTYPSVAIVTAPPTSVAGALEALWI